MNDEQKIIINTQGGPAITGGNFIGTEFVANKYVVNESSKTATSIAMEVEEVEKGEEIKGKDESATTENCEQEPSPAQSPFTEEQIKASGIKKRPDIVLALMRDMQPECKNKVDWLSFYTVLLRRGWVEENVSEFCRMVGELFGVKLNNQSFSKDLSKNSSDYTRWTESDARILRRKHLAEEFDQRLTEYFKRGREEVMKGVR